MADGARSDNVGYNVLRLDDGLLCKKLVGSKGSVVFLGGLASSMAGTKANALFGFCQQRDIGLVLFDYLGHGQSEGRFTDHNISDWLSNCINVIDKLTVGPQMIVGSSMGGWLMLLVALNIPERIKALVGIAAAPDFTEDLIFQKMTDLQKRQLLSQEYVEFFGDDGICSYQITRNLIEDARQHLLMRRDSINISCPIRLIHGTNDIDVPYQTSLKLAEKVISKDVRVHLLKSADHGMSDPRSLSVIFDAISEFYDE